MKLHNRRPEVRLRRSATGFSLAELMVVIVIIGLLATLVVPQIMSSLERANRGKAKSDLIALHNALNEYAINNSSKYPEDLSVLVEPDEFGHTFLAQKSIPTDPWGNEYQYEPPVSGQPDPRVFTWGKDGAPGGDGSAADMSNLMVLGAAKE